jgi:hypothetical protein
MYRVVMFSLIRSSSANMEVCLVPIKVPRRVSVA